MPHKPGIGAIFGIVSEDGLVKENSPVILIDSRRDADGQHQIVGRQLTKPDGGFVFNGLDTTYTDYMLVATDEDGVEPKNALIQDRVQPITAHQGSTWWSNWWVNAWRNKAVIVGSGYPGLASDSRNIVDVKTGAYVVPLGLDASGLSLTVGAPHIPAVNVLPPHGPMYFGGLSVQQQDPTIEEISLEWVIDRQQFDATNYVTFAIGFNISTSSSGGVNAFGSYNVSDAPRTVLGIEVRQSQVRAMIGYANISNNNFTADSSRYTRQLTTDTSAHPDTLHIVVTSNRSQGVKLYINGVLIGEHTGHVPVQLVYSGGNYGIRPVVGVFGGVPSDLPSISFLNAQSSNSRFGPFACYYKELSAVEIQKNYDLLFSTSELPVATGYEREVLFRHPQMYARLNEVDLVAGEWFCYNKPEHDSFPDYRGHMAGSVHPTHSQPSPIAGGNAVAFTNGYVLANFSPHFHASPREASFSCWVKFDAAAPTGNQFFASNRAVNNSSLVFFAAGRNASGHIFTQSFVSGETRITTFDDYTPPSSAWLAVYILLDTIAETLQLWVGTDSAAPTLVSTKVQPVSGSLYSMLTTGGAGIDRTGTFRSQVRFGEGLQGALCEVALYPHKLNSDDIQDIWAAKDVA